MSEPQTTIELVRHSKAQRRDRWWGRPDRDRPLVDDGRHQSRALAKQLHARGDVDALYSSAFVRCVQTLEPLAAITGLEIVPEDALAEATTLPVLDGGNAWVASAWLGGRAVAFVNRVAAEHAGQRVVACSHGDVIPALMAVLAGRDNLEVADVRLKKGARFTLTLSGLRCTRVEHSPPLE